MKKWNEYYNPTPIIFLPKPEVVYFYYEKGKAYGPFADKPNKPHTERVIVNEEEIKEYWDVRRAEEKAAFDAWYKDLREEYEYVSDKEFNFVYSKAYENAHSSGYDSVNDKLEELFSFIEDVIAIRKREEN